MSAETRSTQDLPSPGVGNRLVVGIAVGLMAMLLGAIAVMAVIYVGGLPKRTLPSPALLPAPQVRIDEKSLRKRLEAEQLSRLSGYRWENSQKTLVGIPIERAMQILGARGPKAYDPIIPSGEAALAPGPATATTSQNPEVRVPANKEASPAEKGLRQP
jgi:hypothetical protein